MADPAGVQASVLATARACSHYSQPISDEREVDKSDKDDVEIEGEFDTVRDLAGHEVRLHVDKTTHQEGTFKVGDKVEAYVTEKGHARALLHTDKSHIRTVHTLPTGEVVKVPAFYAILRPQQR